MSPEKDAALCKAFPHLFRDRHASLHQSLMGFGFEHGDGWYDLIYAASSKIEPIIIKMIDDAIKSKDPNAMDYIPCASQIKEKFGTLRFYMTFVNEEIDKIIDEAEAKSAVTCEYCGQEGKLRGKAWVVTLCAKCWKKYKEDRGQ